MNLQESIRKTLREIKEEKKVNIVKKMIYAFYKNVSFIEQSTFENKPLIVVYFDSNDPAANIESWFNEKLLRDINDWTSGEIVVCSPWTFNWDERKKNVDVYVDTILLKYDENGNVINE